MESIIIYCTLEFETFPLPFALRFIQVLDIIMAPFLFFFLFLALFHGKKAEKVMLISECHYVDVKQLTRITM